MITALAALSAAACGGGGDSVTEPEAPPSYAGVWEGQTSRNRTVRVVVNGAGGIDSLKLTVRLSLGGGYCTGPMILDSPTPVVGNKFTATVVFPGSTIRSTVHGTFGSSSALSGDYEGYSGSFAVVCGNNFSIGTGSLLSAGTFQATKK
jgi:hypothetical protein